MEIKEFIKELEHNKEVNLANKLSNSVDIDYVIDRLNYIISPTRILEKHFKIYETDDELELEAWTDGRVDMIIYLDNDSDYVMQLENYVNNFDIDEEIDIHRQDELYRKNFTITQSVKDFEAWVQFIKDVIEEMKK